MWMCFSCSLIKTHPLSPAITEIPKDPFNCRNVVRKRDIIYSRKAERSQNNAMNIFRKLFFLIWYFKEPPWDTNQTPPEVYDYIAHAPPGRALDLGCGTGTNAITLIKNGWQVTGVDFIAKAILTARRKANLEGVAADFRVGDVTKLDGVQGFFDLILDIGCYQSLDPSGMRDYRENIQRLLGPGGAYMIYLFFRSEDASSGSGATQSDLEPFSDFLDLIQRQEGTERGIRQSAWLTYRKPI